MPQRACRRSRHTHALGPILLCALTLHLTPALLRAQAPAKLPPPPDVDAPLADPVVRDPPVFFGRSAKTWRDGQARVILLEGDAGFELGVFGFQAKRAVVRIDPQHQPGLKVYHLAIYLEEARSARGKGRLVADGERLLVTASTTGRPSLKTDLLDQLDQAPVDALVAQANQRVDRLRVALAKPLIQVPDDLPVYNPEEDPVRQARRAQIDKDNRMAAVRLAIPPDRRRDRPVPTEPRAPRVRTEPAGVLPTRGVVRFNADRVVYERKTDQREAALMLIGNVKVFYTDYDSDRTVSLIAQRVVIFIDEDRDQADASIAGQQVDAANITGIYLEDNAIITDGQYTVRAPRAYYNVAQNKAVLLEAVLYTDDITRKIPLYVRAQTLRQTSADTFVARDARFTTSEFGEPHFAIGAKRVTVDRRPGTDGLPRNLIIAEKTTLRWYDTPLLALPTLQGSPGDIPLRGLSIGSNNNGVRVETQWDLFSLTGNRAPKGVDLTGNIDYQGDHGPAVGLNLEYELPEFYGSTEGYFLPIDNGTDEIADRLDVEQDDAQRGFAHLLHRHNLAYGVELSLEAAYVSDPTFLEEFFRSEAYDAKEYETSIYAKKQDNQASLDFYARYDITDFTPQLTTLQAPGYTVARGPELRYFRTGTPLLDGKLNWYTENRVGRLRLLFGDDTPLDRGFTPADSLRFFGIPNSTRFDDAARANGLPTNWVTRGDTRHEIEAPLDFGTLDVTPYAVGRVTAWDDKFSDFNGGAIEDNVRFWGGGGVRASTEFTKTYDGIHNDLFDVHQIRHIIEPLIDVFWFGSTIDPDDLPIYDPEVEGITEGAGVRVGMVNTFQTKRGGPGRWRSVDWLKIQTDLLLRSDDADRDAPIARYFDYRPEYSIGGDHFYSQILWMVTDTLGFEGDVTYDLEDHGVAQWRVALSADHTPRLRSFVGYSEIDVLDSRLLTYGFDYQATAKYTFGFIHRIDFAEGESRAVALTIDRKLPRWQLRGVVEYDQIDDETIIGFILIPAGFDLNASPIRVFSGG